ncbi:VanZ family protein [Flavobacterium sp.]|uniref:VanZ family protein n=1 Tax=Flavobacterium sp. TaxID=239 RepID=UPI00333F1A74
MKSTRHLLGHNFFKITAIFWTLLIFYLCLNDVPSLPSIPIENLDKIIHFIFYFVFVFLWIMSFKNISLRYFLIVLFIALLLGISIEFLQKNYTKNRAFDWYDIVANTLGAITGFILVKYYHKTQNKNISH